ncbi:MAG: trypsin-like peptidase domain-containing protein, partial [Planctomycetia bacterium]
MNAAVLVLATVLWADPIPLVVDPRLDAVQTARVAMIEKAAPAVTAVFGPKGGGGGSGVVATTDGLVLTNFHVVQGQGPFLRCGLSDGDLLDAVLVGVDPVGDLAVLQL